MKNFCAFLMVLCCCKAMAQFGQNYKALADKAFNNKDYYEAAYYYKKVAVEMKILSTPEIPYQPVSLKRSEAIKADDKVYVTYHLAESYRMYENYTEAETWYAKVLEQHAEVRYPLSRLWYGVCLRANQHFNEALNQLKIFSSSYQGEKKYVDLAKQEIANCNFALESYKNPLTYSVSKLRDQWNSDGSNYAMVRTDKGYWLTSSRMDKDDKKRLNRIYYASADLSKPEPVHFNDPEQRDVEYGTPSFDPTGRRMYLTKWFKSGKVTSQNICMSTLQSDGWSAPVNLNTNVNVSGYHSIQPFITSDGKKMFFVSDKPGGKGGDDIWMSDLDEAGMPINSMNLSTINTVSDEQAPYYDLAANRLIFSSKGLTGLGGFDFFESYGSGLNLTTPTNLGYPLNSAKDDLYYHPRGSGAPEFYISSDRESECCLDLFLVTDNSSLLNGKLQDCATGKLLSGAKLRFTDAMTMHMLGEATSDQEANYTFKISTTHPVNVSIEKDGYFSKTVSMSQVNKASADLCLQGFTVGKPMVIRDVLYDFNAASLRPESKAVLDEVVTLMKDNPSFRIELGAHTDGVGSEAYNLKLSQERAENCVSYIVGKGIDQNRIFAKGYGESKPVAPNTLTNGRDNAAGRQLNRRTEFTVLQTQ